MSRPDSIQKPAFPAMSLFLICMLSLAGISVSLYLTWLHYKVFTHPGFHSFCAMSDAFNCETVAESPYSVFFALPVSVWGLLGYSLMLFLSAHDLRNRKLSAAFVALLFAAVFSVIVSTVLAFVSYCVICSFCVMCSISYLINLALLGILVCSAIRLRLSPKAGMIQLLEALNKDCLKVLAFLGLITILAVLYPKYWINSSQGLSNGRSGVTAEGHHWIGAETPSLEITEFSDYMCPHCRRSHDFLRKLLTLNPSKVRLIHRHFPLDEGCNPLIKGSFHPGACLMAEASICAGRQGRFWEMNDILFSDTALGGAGLEERIKDVAEKIGLKTDEFLQCLASRETREELKEDIDDGLSLKLSGTPSLVVNGRVYVGAIAHSVFRDAGVAEPRTYSDTQEAEKK